MAYPNATVTPSGLTWAQFQSSGFQGLLEALITANLTANAAPTVAVALSVTGAGGTLVAASYYVVSTETNAFGETTPGPTGVAQVISGTQELVITPPALKTGNIARNYYWGTASIGPFTLLASGQTGTTTTILAPPPANSHAVGPPSANSTGLEFVDASGITSNKALELIRDLEKSAGNPVVNFLISELRAFLGGSPVPFNSITQKLNHVRGVVAIWNQAMNEIGTLVDANPGTLGMSPIVGNLFPNPRRTWP